MIDRLQCRRPVILFVGLGIAGTIGAQSPTQITHLTSTDMEKLWTDLSGTDIPQAHQASRTLIMAARQSVPYLKERLRPAKPKDPERCTRLIADLDDDRFAVRERAMRELETLGQSAAPALRQVLAEGPSLETRRRVERLMDKLEASWPLAERLPYLRALSVLEQTSTNEGHRFLESLAREQYQTWLTQEAKQALQRLAERDSANQPEDGTAGKVKKNVLP